MPQRVVILGGGVGGTIVANVLARSLHRDEANVTVVDATGQHQYMPGWLYLPFNNHPGLELTHTERTLLNRHVNLTIGQVTEIDTNARELTVYPQPGTDGIGASVLPYDYLVVATGAHLALEDLPGLAEGAGKWHHFYSLDGALALRAALHQFEGGRIVVGIGGIPYRCPPAPLEFVFLLEDWLRQHGLREKTEVQYTFPLGRVFTIESVAEMITPYLDERGVKYTTFFNAEEVDTEHRLLKSLEGEEIPYDLLVIVPPHRGARVISDSKLGDEQGWIPTDRTTLAAKGGIERVFALGDATDLPVSKSGSAAHFEAKVVAHRIVALVRGEDPDPRNAAYNGDVMCFLEAGHNTATQLVFDYEHPPQPPRPSLFYHMEKQLFNYAYWHLVPPGLV
jgi:sulfide:quinone oxidoreductase